MGITHGALCYWCIWANLKVVDLWTEIKCNVTSEERLGWDKVIFMAMARISREHWVHWHDCFHTTALHNSGERVNAGVASLISNQQSLNATPFHPFWKRPFSQICLANKWNVSDWEGNPMRWHAQKVAVLSFTMVRRGTVNLFNWPRSTTRQCVLLLCFYSCFCLLAWKKCETDNTLLKRDTQMHYDVLKCHI